MTITFHLQEEMGALDGAISDLSKMTEKFTAHYSRHLSTAAQARLGNGMNPDRVADLSEDLGLNLRKLSQSLDEAWVAASRTRAAMTLLAKESMRNGSGANPALTIN